MPCFAVGRAQQLLYHLAELIRRGALPEIPIYLDSPMAIAATEVYLKHPELADEAPGAFESRRALRGPAQPHLHPSTADIRAR